jgi:nitrite reductase (NO-forming)
MGLAIGPMPERQAAAPASPRLTERHILRLGIALAAGFILLSVLAGFAPLGALHGWVSIHLALAGAASVAIGTFMPHFGVTLAGTRPEPPALRLAGVLALAAGMAGVALARPLAGDLAAAVSGGLVLIGITVTAWTTFAPLRSGLARRHPIVQVTYGVALADVAIGATLAILFLAGWQPVTAAWIGLKPAHAWLNVFGFVSVTIAGTLIYLWPTMLGARVRAHPTMALAVGGLLLGPPLVALGSWLHGRPLAVAGGVAVLLGAAGLLGYGLEVWRRRGTWTRDLAWHRLAARHGLAGMAWFVLVAATALVGLVRDGAAVPGWSLGPMAVPLIGGWTLQVLVGAWGHLLPAVGPGDMAAKARQREVLGRWGTSRVLAWNAGLLLLWPGFGLGLPVLIAAGVALFGAAALTSLALLAMALLGSSSPRVASIVETTATAEDH